jgi:hypothetical protein
LHLYDRDSLSALVIFLEQTGDSGNAISYAQKQNDLEPDSPEVRQMLKVLHASTAKRPASR